MTDIMRARLETGAILGLVAVALVLAFRVPEGSLALSVLLLGLNASARDFRHVRHLPGEGVADMLDRWFRQMTAGGTLSVIVFGSFLASLAGVLQGDFEDAAPRLLFYAFVSGVFLYMLLVFVIILSMVVTGMAEAVYRRRLDAIAARRAADALPR